jgi:uncharacterized membrane protein
MIELLALLSAVFYGSADFFGGLTARRTNTVATVFVSQLSGLVLILFALPFLQSGDPSSMDWIWGVIAGLSGGVGVALLYRALAVGIMAVVAPITAVCAAMIPVIAAFANGERLRLTAMAGIALAFAAIAMVSQSPSDSGQNPGAKSRFSTSLMLALLAGVIIGLFFLSLARTSIHAGMWPLIAARVTSIALFGFFALATGCSIRMDRTATTTASVGGGLDMIANILYMLTARIGPLSIVVTLASLYPAATVVLARIVLHERLSRVQAAGIVCALVAVVLIVSN